MVLSYRGLLDSPPTNITFFFPFKSFITLWRFHLPLRLIPGSFDDAEHYLLDPGHIHGKY